MISLLFGLRLQLSAAVVWARTPSKKSLISLGLTFQKYGSNTKINECVETFLTWVSATMFSSGFRWRVKASLISRTPSNSTSTSTTCSLSPSLNSISAHTDTKKSCVVDCVRGYTCVRRWFPEFWVNSCQVRNKKSGHYRGPFYISAEFSFSTRNEEPQRLAQIMFYCCRAIHHPDKKLCRFLFA